MRMACESGCSAPPAAPWITRASTSSPRLAAAPHAAEASVNTTMQPIKNRFRPKSPASHPVIGNTMALDIR